VGKVGILTRIQKQSTYKHPGFGKVKSKKTLNIDTAGVVEIYTTPTWAKITKIPSILQNYIEDKYKIFSRKARFDWRYKSQQWDGKIPLIKKGIVGAGLVPFIIQDLIDIGMQPDQITLYDVMEDYIPARVFDAEWHSFDLYEHQQVALARMKEQKRGIVKIPTGGGKSLLFSRLIHDLGYHTLVLVHSRDLLNQTYANMTKTMPNVKIGRLGGGYEETNNVEVLISTYKSMLNLFSAMSEKEFRESMKEFDILICDECHMIAKQDDLTKTWQTVMNIPATYKFGISATPFDPQQGRSIATLAIFAAFGPLLMDMRMEEAQEKHIVVPMEITFLRPRYQYAVLCDETMLWVNAHKEAIVYNDVRNNEIINLAIKKAEIGEKVIVISHMIEHNTLLFNRIKETFDNTWQIHGQKNKAEREQNLKNFANAKDGAILLASSIANEGLDIADISVLIVAEGGKSYFSTVQRIGRGLRLAPGKKYLEAYDFNDADLGVWFAKHTEKRVDMYRQINAKIIMENNED
jgi:superfamily II DNA or RNA helicase